MVLIHGYFFLHSRTCGKQKWNLFYLGSSKYSISNLIIPRLKMYHMSRNFIAISAYLFDVNQTCHLLRQKRVLFAIIDFNQSFGNHEIASRNNYQDSIHPLAELKLFGVIAEWCSSHFRNYSSSKDVFIKIHVGNHSFIMCNFLPDD